MSGDTSEEKTLPPSGKKLKDAREKGQVFQSVDLVSGISTAVAFIFLWLVAGKIVRDFQVSTNSIQINIKPRFEQTAWDATETLGKNLGIYVIGLALIVIVMIVLVNLFVLKGFIFTLEPMKPNFDNMNPIEGLKRIFSLKSLIELLKQILKSAIILTVGISLILLGLNSAFRIPSCNFNCVPAVFISIIGPFIAVAIVVFLASGIFDLGLQRWLFNRKLKMTKTEYKRERKDQDGSPEIKSAQRRQRQALLQTTAKLGIEDATLLVEGGGTAVGIRYVRGETPIPLIVCKGRATQAERYIELSYYFQIPMYTDAELASALQAQMEVGGYITENFFDEVAIALQRSR